MINMEDHEHYEYARKRVKQKKRFYYHTILFIVGSLAMLTSNTLFDIGGTTVWYPWAISSWLFFLILHFIRVFITDRFMGKDWEREEINKLVLKQEQKSKQIKDKLEDNKNNS